MSDLGRGISHDLITAYRESEKQISSISQERDRFSEEKEREVDHIGWEVYEPKIDALKKERDEKINKIRDEIESNYTTSTEKINELHKNIKKVERILDFLKPTNRTAERVDFDESAIKTVGYTERHIEKIGIFYKDEFLKIIAYIVENDKPKNKYSLTLVGRSIFTEEQMAGVLGYDCRVRTYGTGISSSMSLDIELNITDKPTIEEVKEYYSKNKERILKPYLEQYQEVKKEYLDVLKTYKIDDFKELIAYRCSNCEKFYTERGARQVSRIEEYTCPICEKGKFVKVDRRGKRL